MDENLVKVRHERSVKDFPELKLEEDEYVVFSITRAKVCLFMVFIGLGAGFIMVLAFFLMIILGQNMLDEMGKNFLLILLMILFTAAVIAGLFFYMVYKGNKMFVTNKRVMQFVMTTPVSNSINIIDLGSIEDASFRQEGILQQFFNYGTLRLSTVGDETTYTFKYSDITPENLREITELITRAKKITKKPNYSAKSRAEEE